MSGCVVRVAAVTVAAGCVLGEGVRRSLYSGEGVSVALSVVARDGSSVVLDEDDVRRVLRGRPVASSWDVDSVLRSFESSLDRRAGEWAAGAGDVVLPPSGWDDELTPFVGDDDEWVNALVVARPPPCGRGVVRRGGECPAAAGFFLVALSLCLWRCGCPHRRVGCLRPRCGSALCVCVSGW